MRKYPIGIQDFRSIREGGFLYVDKTRLTHTLIESGKYYFLSRPRRFGKSLLLSTIKEIMSGSKELFKGLWIEDKWDWEQKYPVIHLKLSQINYQKRGLYDALNKELDIIAQEWGIVLEEIDLKDKFRELIKKASANGKVVILIDEYDKPIIDYLDDIAKAEENRAVFKSFYSVLKDADEYIRLLLITGVSRFSKVSIFSDLNNLNDITLHPRYATLTGITQEELETNFAGEIAGKLQGNPHILGELKNWYNGYSWNEGTDKVYNPFSLLGYMDAGVFRNFWIDTGAPTFLIKEFRRRTDIEFAGNDIAIGESGIGNFDIADINTVALLFQTGYLTIKSFDQEYRDYVLTYPNLEVKSSMLTYLVAAYTYEDLGQVGPNISQLKRAFVTNDIPKVIAIIDRLFANLKNTLWVGATERFYHAIIQNSFQLLNIHMESEKSFAASRLDMVVDTPTHIYVLEFKLDATAQKALDQIFANEYLKPFQLDPRKKVAIGINFSSEKKRVNDYLVQEVG